MRRFIARTGSGLVALVFLGVPAVARTAPSPPPALTISGARFVGVADPSLAQLLARLGARLSWHSGSRDVLITTADHTVIAFTVWDRAYRVGSLTAQAQYAPYLKGTEPFLPLKELLSALSLAIVGGGSRPALEPLLGTLDVRSSAAGSVVVARAAVPLHAQLVARSAAAVTYAFAGVGASVAGTRTVNAGGIRDVVVRSSGSLATARTTLTVDLQNGARAAPARSDDGRDFSLAVAAPPVRSAPSSPAATAVPPPSGTLVTAVNVAPSASDFTIDVLVSGDATYAWHRLPAPDDRFWIDIQGARLATLPRDDRWIGRVTGVRVQQDAGSVVRVALSLGAQQSIAVVPFANGVRVVVANALAADAPHGGSGSIGSVVAATVETPPPAPEPAQTALLTPAPFHPSYVPTNPRLIVIDPGHGGNDPGTVVRGAEEKTFTLDIALRLRDVLEARGWQVRMTRTTDTEVDPAAVTDHDELQARVDVANDNGARLFLSIHGNWYSSPDPNGATTYWSKPEDVALARDVEDAVARETGITNRGIVKSKLYVTFHTRMPAALIETAFLSNPQDLAHLESPQWRQRVAEAIADGIEQYARDNPVPPAPGG